MRRYMTEEVRETIKLPGVWTIAMRGTAAEITETLVKIIATVDDVVSAIGSGDSVRVENDPRGAAYLVVKANRAADEQLRGGRRGDLSPD